MSQLAYKTIITAREVVYYTPRKEGTDLNNIRHFLPLKEEQLFNVWLGGDWYAALIADLVDYTNAFVPFQEGTTYNLATVVLWRDKLYKVTGNPTSAGTLPSDQNYWDEAPKFATETNEYLWRRYLRTVLAWHILHTGLVYGAIQQAALGIVQAGRTEQTMPVRGRDLASFKSEVGEDFTSFVATMDAYLRANKSTFPLYKGNVESQSCDAPAQHIGRPNPNFGFSLS